MLQGAGESPGQRRRPAELRVDRGQVGQVEVELGIGEAGRGPALQAGGGARALQLGALEGVAVVDLGQAPGEAGRPPEQPVEDGLAEGEALAAQVHLRAHGLAGRVAGEPGGRGQAAGERPAGEVGEGGEVGERRLHRAGQGVLADTPGIVGGQRRALHVQPRHRQGVVGLQAAREVEGGPVSEGAAQGGIGQAQAFDPRVGGQREAAGLRGLGLEVGLDALQGAVRRAQARGLEAAGDAGTSERPLQAPVEDQGPEFGLGGLGHPALGRHRAGLEGEVGHARRVQAAARVEAGGAGDQLQPVDAERPAVGEAQRPVELRRPGEHDCGRAGQQALDARGEVEGQAPVRPDPGDLRRTLGADALAGREVEAGVPGVEGAAPVEVEVDGRRAGQVQALREQAAGRLRQGRLHLQALAVRHEQQACREQPARIEPAHAHVEVEALGRGAELRPPLRREAGRLPGDGLAQDEFGQGEALDLDLDRQVRQELAVGLGRRRDGGRHGPAQHLDAAEFEAVHLQPAREQGQAAPDDAGPVEAQPDPVAVAHRHVADGRVRGQRPIHRADGDAGGRRGERLREQAPEHGLLALVGRAGEARGGGEQQEQAGGRDAPCPAQCRQPRPRTGRGPLLPLAATARARPSPLCGGGWPSRRRGSGEGSALSGYGVPLSRLSSRATLPRRGGRELHGAPQPRKIPEKHHQNDCPRLMYRATGRSWLPLIRSRGKATSTRIGPMPV
ncbi:hypothetical protein MPOCJGCO_1147 [Methylobacterium trifolii]|uniref:Uncharacterized protein n=1 Tax=Methylobacterium trifolii TaxID=1003092 RepID=A0ABQ4TZN5_9HYPH|nr:hypothetical protein MPOCJGCO_1147 [Methylobacterium trifolii]